MNKESLLSAVLAAILIGGLVLASAMRFETVQAASASGDWSMFRSDPSHSGVGTDNPEGNPVLTPTQLWKTNITWTMTERHKKRDLTEPAVVDGVVYVGARSDIYVNQYRSYVWIDVYAFNATNGAEIWNYRDDSCDSISSPAVVNGVVYFATDRYICALKASNGALLWNYSAGMFYSNPAVVQDRLFIGSGATLLALNANNGHSIWNYTADGVVYSPSVANGIVYAGSSDWNIYAFNASTGDKIWNYYAGDVLVVPTVAKGVVYACLVGANIYALDAANGAKIWNYSIYDYWSNSESNLAIMNDIVYARSLPDNVYALKADSGAKIWSVTLGHEISAPTVVNDVIYLGSDNALFAINAHNGDILWNYTKGAGFGSPVVVNGVAYVGDLYGGEDNQLHAIAFPSPQLPEREPFPTVLVAIASIGLVAGIGAGLIVYFKKRKR